MKESFKAAADYDEGNDIDHKYHFPADREKLYWEVSEPGCSRVMYEKVASGAEQFFVNLHPVAVRTFVE